MLYRYNYKQQGPTVAMHFSDLSKQIPSSAIREILLVAQNPAMISFAGGLPDDKLFPLEELKGAFIRAAEQYGSRLYQYGESLGVPELRAWITDQQLRYSNDQNALLITNGSQQGLSLLTRTLFNPHDVILVESPAYLGALQTFASQGVRCQSVDMRPDGIDLDQFEERVKSRDIQYFYMVPNFQNPTGISYSLPCRQQLVSLCRQYGIWVIEDDPYGALRYEGEALPSMGELMPEQTITLGSFSKIVAPSFRLGWVNAPKEVITQMEKFKQADDLHTSCLNQFHCLSFLQSAAYETHICNLKTTYARRYKVMKEKLSAEFDSFGHCAPCSGGMFLWFQFKDESIDLEKLFDRAKSLGVLFVAGHHFLPFDSQDGDSNHQSSKHINLARHSMRLNFTNSSEEKITKGLFLLKQAIIESTK